MKHSIRNVNPLAEILLKNKKGIIHSWCEAIEETTRKHSIHLEENEIEAIATACLAAYIKSTDSGEKDATTAPFSQLGQRLDSKILILLEVLYNLHSILLKLIKTQGAAENEKMETQLEATIQELAARLIDQNASSLQKRIDEANSRVTLLNYMVGMVANSLNLTEVLTQAGDIIAKAAGANHTFFYMITEENDLMIFIPATNPSIDTWKITGSTFTRHPRNLLSPQDALWQVLEEKKPVSIYDAQNAPNTTHEGTLRKSGIKSFLLVPCLSKGEVVAVAVVQVHDRLKEFSTEEVQAAQAIASVVAPAIENARLHQKVEQLAALEERGRMARAMHDSLAQTLAAMQMKTSQTGELLNTDKIEAARKNIRELNQIAREAYTDVREVIFNLRARAPGGTEFIPFLRNNLATYQTCFGITTSLEAREDITSGVSDEATDQIMYIIQESLANTRKHAEASTIKVLIQKSGQILQVDIMDNGAGFDATQVDSAQKWQHFGLQIMKERAAAIGGIVNIDSLPGMGTRIRLSIPVPGAVNQGFLMEGLQP